MPGLVLEGGAFRPVFSCGVMDALLDNDIMFDYVIGVSAGITYAASYLSRQRRRNINMRQYRGDKRYFGARNLLHDHSIFGTDSCSILSEPACARLTGTNFTNIRVNIWWVLPMQRPVRPNTSTACAWIVRARCCERPALSRSLLSAGADGPGETYYDGDYSRPNPILRSLHGNRQAQS